MELILFNKFKYLSKQKLTSEKNLLYLAEWCLGKEHLFNKKNRKILIKNNTKNKIQNNYNELYKIYKEFLNNLSYSLNSFHGLNLSRRAWEILIGRWLWLYLDTIKIRWDLVNLIQKNKYKKIYSLDVLKKKLITLSSVDIARLSQNSEVWNIGILNEIILFKKIKNLHLIPTNKINNDEFIKRKKLNLSYSKYMRLNKINRKLFLYNLDLSQKEKIELLLKNAQFPVLPKNKNYIISPEINDFERLRFKKLFKFKYEKKNMLRFMYDFLPNIFPSIYLENYKNIDKISYKNNWPKNPKFILSSYGHYIDEIFKFYLSRSVSQGSKYMIFQHGAAGMYKNHMGQFFEERICDYYFTWGWKKSKKNIPFCVTKKISINQENKIFRNKNILILIYQMPLMPIKTAYGNSNFSILNKHYTEFLMKFLESIKPKIRKNIFLKSLNWYKPFIQLETIKNKFKETKTLKSTKKVHEISNDYCLTIETYLSTAFLESMYQNRPTIILLDENMTNLDLQAEILFKKLKSVNICFTDLKKAAQFISKNKLDLEKWWNNDKLQETRKEFCNKYARNTGNRLNLLLNELNKIIYEK